MYAVLNEDPDSIDTPDVPLELKRIIERMLKKNRDERYKKIIDVLDHLKKIEWRMSAGTLRPAPPQAVDRYQSIACESRRS